MSRCTVKLLKIWLTMIVPFSKFSLWMNLARIYKVFRSFKCWGRKHWGVTIVLCSKWRLLKCELKYSILTCHMSFACAHNMSFNWSSSAKPTRSRLSFKNISNTCVMHMMKANNVTWNDMNVWCFELAN